jgi:hypothetical protein
MVPMSWLGFTLVLFFCSSVALWEIYLMDMLMTGSSIVPFLSCVHNK